MNKVKDLFINHIEKLVLLIFIGGGGFHLFTTLKPTDQSNKKEELEKLVKQVLRKHANSPPPLLPVPPYFNQMQAPFMRVPRIEPAGSWRWYKVPEVTNKFSIREGDEKVIRLSFVRDISKIEITEGKKFAVIKVSPSTEPSLLVLAIAPGTITAVCYSISGTTETWIIEIFPKIIKSEGDGKLAFAPLKIDPVVERGAIRVRVLVDPQNWTSEKALPLAGYKIYRKVGKDGEWTEIYFKDTEKKETEEVIPDDTKDEANIPELPGLPVDLAPPDVGIIKKGKKKNRDKGPDGEESVPLDQEQPKQKETDKGWLVYTDREVKPDTTYIYAATTVSHLVHKEETLEETTETKQNECISEPVVSKSNLEIYLSGTFNNAASIYVKKYFTDTKFEKKLFNVPVGDTIGTPRRMKIDGEYQQVDFSTGSILVDILKQVRDTTSEKRLIRVKDKNGRYIIDNGRIVRKEVTIETVSEHTKIVVLDAKGRIREYLKK